MSNTATALLVKLVMTLLFAGLTLVYVDGNPWSWVFLIAFLVTAVNYLAGDLVVLPAFGNLIASIGDGVMAALLAYVVDLLTPAVRTSAASLVVFAVLVAIGEYFFHQYLRRSDTVEP